MLLLLAPWLLCPLFHIVSAQLESITLIGLAPFNGPSAHVGNGVKPAVDLAVQDVNRNKSVLPNFQLNVDWLDSKCDMATSTKRLFEMLQTGSKKTFLFGGYCSSVTKPLAESIGYFNLTQISFADPDPSLSDQKTYNHFLRVVPSELEFNSGQISFMKHFNWSRAAMLFQDASTGISTYAYTNDNMISKMQAGNIDIITAEGVAEDPAPSLYNIEQKDGRIIIANLDGKMARSVICQAYHKQMYGFKYVWILSSTLPQHWWKNVTLVNCTVSNMEQVLNGHFQITMPIVFKEAGSFMINGKDYEKAYNKARGKEFSKYHGYAYDSVWLMALALHNSLEGSGDFNQTAFLQSPIQQPFIGATGKVEFVNRTRLGHLEVEQFIDGSFTKVGVYDMSNDSLLLDDSKIFWHGHSEPPLDRIIRVTILEPPDLIIRFSLFTMALLGMCLAFAFLAVNIKFRKTRYIKMSSPNMNNIIIVGCLLTFTSVFLLRVDSQNLSDRFHQGLCIARSWALSIGFSLAFGAMFAKTWRVYSIFNAPHKQKRVIKDQMLLLIVVVLVLIDLILLTTWNVLNPFQVATNEQDPIVEDQKIITPIFKTCQSDNMNIWIPIFYGYKGLLLVIGCYFAWQTRQVCVPALNDSKYIGMSVYNVVIMCAAAVAISYIIKDRPDFSFLIIGILIILCTTITLCLVFGPKILHLRKDPKDRAPRVRVTLKRSVNTNSMSQRGGATPDILELETRMTELSGEYNSNINKLDALKKQAENLEHPEVSEKQGNSSHGESSSATVILHNSDVNFLDVDSAYKGMSFEESRLMLYRRIQELSANFSSQISEGSNSMAVIICGDTEFTDIQPSINILNTEHAPVDILMTEPEPSPEVTRKLVMGLVEKGHSTEL